MEASFYQLRPSSSVTAFLPRLLTRCLERGWRSVVRVEDDDVLQSLDRFLWTYRDDSFLPHGAQIEGGGMGKDAPMQPIYLTSTCQNPNHADSVFLLPGASWRQIDEYERAFFFHHSEAEETMIAFRKEINRLAACGHSVKIWCQSENGKWQSEEQNPA